MTRGRAVYGGQRHFLPIKVNHAGVMPIIFASALLLIIPAFLGKRWAGRDSLDETFNSQQGFWYVVVYARPDLLLLVLLDVADVPAERNGQQPEGARLVHPRHSPG